MTKHHALVLADQPQAYSLATEDFSDQAAADARRADSPRVVSGYRGSATIESYTVLYTRDGEPHHGEIYWTRTGRCTNCRSGARR